MSAGNGDEILCALNKIEQDILQGKFEWKDSEDVHTNIMEALVKLVGEKAKELTKSNKSDRCLFVLKTWCMDCVESIATRIKQIQVHFPYYNSTLVIKWDLCYFFSVLFCIVLMRSALSESCE